MPLRARDVERCRFRLRPFARLDLVAHGRKQHPHGRQHLVERGHVAVADVEDRLRRQRHRRGAIDGAPHVLGIDVFVRQRLRQRDADGAALEGGFDQVVHLLSAARARPIVAEPEHVGGPQHDQLETMRGRIGFEDELLGALEIAVAARAAAREILGHAVGRGFRGFAPAVIDGERAQMHQAAHAGEPHALGHVAGAAEIDVEGEVERLLHTRADETRGVHQRVDPVRRGDRDQGGQIAHVVARQREVAGAELHAQKIRPRLRIEEHHALAARQRAAGELGPDQARAGHQGGHGLSPVPISRA